VPLGWFPPVTPGTKHVSLGGAVAADVHGKNHHRDGSIGIHVLELEMILADGSRALCSPGRNAELFWSTIGGMGLTGVIAKVTLQLIPIETSSIAAQHFKAPDLEAAFRWLEDSEHDDHYTVACIDCLSRGRSLGRSIVMRGHHASRGELGAQALGIRVYTIGVGTEGEAPYPIDDPILGRRYINVQADIDEETLQQIAEATGGRFFRATDAQALQQIFSTIDRMERTEIKVRGYTRHTEQFAWFLYPGALLILLELALAGTVLRTIP